MCGIFALINGNSSNGDSSNGDSLNGDSLNGELIEELFMLGKERGPENFKFFDNYKNMNISIGFHRLAINGLNEISNQPIVIDNILLICNGEIYNYKQLFDSHHFKQTTNSDCEIIIHMYMKYGMNQMLKLLHGVFAFILIDYRDYENLDLFKVFSARDTYGIRPMFYLEKNNGTLGFSSELKQLSPLYASNEGDIIKQFPPGHVKQFDYYKDKKTNLKLVFSSLTNFKYDSYNHWTSFELYNKHPTSHDIQYNLYNINKYLKQAVEYRVHNTDRPVACLLSGGLDSSLITALVAKHYKNPNQLETYSIGLKDAEDLKYARKVAEYIGTNHHEIIVSEDDFFNAIPEVINTIESYDTTTVRASVGNYLIGKYISEHSNAKVIFNGDGSDELTGGYLYMHHAPTNEDFDMECRRLLDNIHYFDVLRSDRCISTHGLEPRTPFLDTIFTRYYLSISERIRNHTNGNLPEKYLLRKAFSQEKILPNEVLWRTKEAFSDGVSSEKNSWHTIIKRKIMELEENSIENLGSLPEITLEQKYYKKIFQSKFGNVEHVIPYYWMPKFIDSDDCSARNLSIYNRLNE